MNNRIIINDPNLTMSKELLYIITYQHTKLRKMFYILMLKFTKYC